MMERICPHAHSDNHLVLVDNYQHLNFEVSTILDPSQSNFNFPIFYLKNLQVKHIILDVSEFSCSIQTLCAHLYFMPYLFLSLQSFTSYLPFKTYQKFNMFHEEMYLTETQWIGSSCAVDRSENDSVARPWIRTKKSRFKYWLH